MATAGIVSVGAYDKTYTNGYSYVNTVNATGTATKAISMKYYHKSPYVYTVPTNVSGNTVYMESYVGVVSKNGGTKKSSTQKGICSNNSAIVATCSDYRSTSTNVYYKHTSTIFGDTTNHTSSSKIASISKTVG